MCPGSKFPAQPSGRCCIFSRVRSNGLDLLALVVDRLEAAAAGVLVFGGWAEKLLGLSPPRRHDDVDLLLSAPSCASIDRLLAVAADAEEVRAKRFAHKRAFRIQGVTIEITLVEHDRAGPVTRFWGEVPFRWLVPVGQAELASSVVRSFPVVTQENLARYRRLRRATQPWRWRDPAALVG
jgi:hypothetical protein